MIPTAGTSTVPGVSVSTFQSRNRETFDSNFQRYLPWYLEQCFNLVIEKLLIPTKLADGQVDIGNRLTFQSRNRETFDSNQGMGCCRSHCNPVSIS